MKSDAQTFAILPTPWQAWRIPAILFFLAVLILSRQNGAENVWSTAAILFGAGTLLGAKAIRKEPLASVSPLGVTKYGWLSATTLPWSAIENLELDVRSHRNSNILSLTFRGCGEKLVFSNILCDDLVERLLDHVITRREAASLITAAGGKAALQTKYNSLIDSHSHDQGTYLVIGILMVAGGLGACASEGGVGVGLTALALGGLILGKWWRTRSRG